MPISLVRVYNVTAMSELEDKENIYKELVRMWNKLKHRGPVYMMGDWNARIQQTNGGTRYLFGGIYI